MTNNSDIDRLLKKITELEARLVHIENLIILNNKKAPKGAMKYPYDIHKDVIYGGGS